MHLISRHQDQLNTFASSLHAPGSGVDGACVARAGLAWLGRSTKSSSNGLTMHYCYVTPPSPPLTPPTNDAGTIGFTDVDVMDTAALEKAIKGMGKLQGLAYCVGSISLKPLKATTTDDFIQVRTCWDGPINGMDPWPQPTTIDHTHGSTKSINAPPGLPACPPACPPACLPACLQAFMLNTVGAATAIRAALPGMMAHYKETGTAASVVLFSSVAVQQGFPNHAIIGAVKGPCVHA